MKNWRLVALLFGFLGLLQPLAVAQGSGSRDMGFGIDGEVRIDLGPDEICAKLLTDSEGNFYFFGNTAFYDSAANLNFLIGKCLPNGKIDDSFGVGGHLSGDFGGFAHSRILDADFFGDALYIIGEGSTAGGVDSQQVFIGKLDLDGKWETGFGVNGIYTRKFIGDWAAAGSIRVHSDGKIAYCGMTTDTNAWHIELPLAGRLLPNGVADSSFGNTGCITWSLAHGLAGTRGQHSDGGKFETILPVGSGYLLGGMFYTSTYGRAMLMMVDEFGNLNDGFGENGLLFPDISPGFTCTVTHSLKKGPKIYLGATLDVFQQGEDFALLTMDSTGTFLDYNGIDFQGNEDRLKDMVLDPHGRILTAGYSRELSSNGPGFESSGFAVAALNDENNLAGEFADQGKYFESMHSTGESGATALGFTADRKLLVAGYVAAENAGNYSDLLIIRLLLDSVAPFPDDRSAEFIVYPNPVQGRLWINSRDPIAYSIWDNQGKLILQNVSTASGIDVSTLSDGVYVIQANGICRRFLKD